MLALWGRLIDRGYAVAGFILLSGAFIAIPVKLSGSLAPGEANPWNTRAMLFLLAGGVALAWAHRRAVGRLLLLGGPINAFLLLALGSAMWSFDPAITLRRVVSLITAILFAYVVAARFSLERIIRLLASASLIVVVASAVFAVALPHIGANTPSHPGAWNGVLAHKNQLGWMTTVMATCYVWLLVNDGFRPRTALALAFCLGVAAMTQSMTTVVTIVLIVVLRAMLGTGGLPGPLRAWLLYGMLGLSALGAVSLVAFWMELMTALNRDPTLTGRIPLWREIIGQVAGHPVLGSGFGAFWLDWNPDMQRLWQVVGWEPPHGHNGYLDLALQLGVVGAALTVAILALSLVRSVSAHGKGGLPGADFVFVYVCCLALGNVTESTLFRGGDLTCALLTISYLTLKKWRVENRPAAAPPPRWRPRRQTGSGVGASGLQCVAARSIED